MSSESFTLNTKAKIPAIAFGGWGGLTAEKREAWKSDLLSVLKAGYRHIDGAWFYRTESVIGAAIRESGIPREEIFLTTKLPFHHAGRVQEFFEDSLKNLGVDYVDLYLMHWPIALEDFDTDANFFPTEFNHLEHPTYSETWTEMEKLLATGKVKAIGVSNFSVKTLSILEKTAKVVPAVNQVETHPYLVQQDLVDYCNEKGIHLTAYSATGRDCRDDPVLKEIAAKHNVSPVQVIFAWDVARGLSVATQSSNEERRKEALDLPKLDKEEITRINALDKQQFAYTQWENGILFGWPIEKFGWEHLKSAEKATSWS